jgi:hypothetical protein
MKISDAVSVIPACPESFFKKDSRRALLAGMTRVATVYTIFVQTLINK